MAIILEPQAYGATPGAGNNTTALNSWWSAVQNTAGAIGEIAGHYPYASPLVWDFATRSDRVKIQFIPGVGRLQYTGTTPGSKGLDVIKSGGGSIGSKSIAGLILENLEIDSNHDGVTFQIGSDNAYDVIESSHIIRPRILNGNTAGTSGALTAKACRIVGHNASVWDCPMVGCKPATNYTTARGSGVALEMIMAVGNTFNSPSVGNANIAFRYYDLGSSALGFSRGNTFNCPDIENTQDGIVADGTASGALNGEVYIGGTMDLVGGGYPMSLKNGAGFFGGAIPSPVLSWVCPPWSQRTNNGNSPGVIKNPNTGFSTTGISVIVS